MARQLCGAFRLSYARGASFDDNLGFLRDMLGVLRQGMKTVVFVLDGLEGMARRAKQLLLYNLFDALAGANVQARGGTWVGVGRGCAWEGGRHWELPQHFAAVAAALACLLGK